MIVVALAALALAALCVVGSFGIVRWLWRTLERANRAHEQQIGELLDRTMHVVNKTWTPPPYARDGEETERVDPFEGIIRDPEQAIDYPRSRFDELEEQFARVASTPEHFTPEQLDRDEAV